MLRYAVATPSGEIVRVLSGNLHYVQIPNDEGGESVDDMTHYVDVATREIREKRPFDYDVAITDLTATITGLPEGLTVETNGQRGTTDSKPLAITYDVPGSYEIELSGLPEYLDETLEVTVGDA